MNEDDNLIKRIELCYNILIGTKFDNFVITNVDIAVGKYNAQIDNDLVFNFNKLFITLLNVKTNKLNTQCCYIDYADKFIQFCINEPKTCLYALGTSKYKPVRTIFKQFVFDIDNKQFFMLDSII